MINGLWKVKIDLKTVKRWLKIAKNRLKTTKKLKYIQKEKMSINGAQVFAFFLKIFGRKMQKKAFIMDNNAIIPYKNLFFL